MTSFQRNVPNQGWVTRFEFADEGKWGYGPNVWVWWEGPDNGLQNPFYLRSVVYNELEEEDDYEDYELYDPDHAEIYDLHVGYGNIGIYLGDFGMFPIANQVLQKLNQRLDTYSYLSFDSYLIDIKEVYPNTPLFRWKRDENS